MKILARFSAVVAFLLCLIGGIWVIANSDSGEEEIWIGIGLYLIGKAFFVGPMLLIAAEQLGPKPSGD
jgi:hypothetical protein